MHHSLAFLRRPRPDGGDRPADQGGPRRRPRAPGGGEAEPPWRVPLWPASARELDSRIVDLNHISKNAFADSIIAALFLQRFVERATSWLHLDIYAWIRSARPARPEGGEA